MGEAIDGEVSAIDRQDLIDTRIVVHGGKHDRVDMGERLINLLREYLPSPLMGTSTRRAHLKQVGGAVQQLEDS